MTPDDRIRAVLDAHAKLRSPAAELTDAADLYAAGMTSHASVNVMLALEDAFDIEFPDELLTKHTFCTISTVRTALLSLTEVAA
ncbi:MAG TPA: acyl carrier protein [Pseudolysinimonas sp.]|jgi:acyl carrier protein|nr:acyl carrier protein [Schumannella sp.]HEV7741039.1 acyl carrier protein [Pseudolysinimonas sp.]